MRNHSPDYSRLGELILGLDDPSPVNVLNQGGTSPFLLIGDHAGRAIPQRLASLGLDPEVLDLHIASDIGVAGLGTLLSERLDACFVSQTYSRLVIDCNRKPGDATSICTSSDGIAIPGNAQLSDDERRARQIFILQPYQKAIADALERGRARGQPTFIVSLHSFTPVMAGYRRPWHFGVLHRHDSLLSSRMLELLRDEFGSAAGDNQPYQLDDKDYTVPLHADAHGLDYLELEVRQDIIASTNGQSVVASLVARMLKAAIQ